MVVAFLPALLANSLPGMIEWPGIHWMKMEDEMELKELWIDEVCGFDKMRASHNGLLSVQDYSDWKMIGIGGCPE